jgi:oligoribonuclease NrnB/cAMP/cGMP phosphodiesterase (DHH superfamily)
MKTIILYHQVKEGIDCPDGIAAAWVAYRYFGKRTTELIGCVYQETAPDLSLEDCDNVVIVDFSFPADVIQQWCDRGLNVTLIDHHKTAMEHLGDVSTFSERFTKRFDMIHSGATLAWQHFFGEATPWSQPKPMPAFLEYVRDRDLWNWELPDSEEVNEAIANGRYQLKQLANRFGADYQKLIFAWFDSLAEMSHQELQERLSPIGVEILAPKREAVAAAASRWQHEALPEIPDSDQPKPYWQSIPIVRCNSGGSEDRLISDICSKLYRELCPSAPFVGCITSDGKYSLRSDKNGSNFDVSAIAKRYGGGGHRNAAGFAVTGSCIDPMDEAKALLENVKINGG